ncbi:hypothetical protein E3N88_14354 [Mikania micrantha]|uniref:Uncharacterized protein n=1 Tax=Mikania micrantha TaxID=192012 RepID=A0A5N6P181_9ASTR|nr:hypothetical protein E3N88_14354 [Mikania micrantha]
MSPDVFANSLCNITPQPRHAPWLPSRDSRSISAVVPPFQPRHVLKPPSRGSCSFSAVVPFLLVVALALSPSRGPEEKLKDPLPKKGQFSASSFDALKAVPTAPRSFSEHFLVMAGISRSWADSSKRPVMVYHGKPMGLFDRMKLSTGDGVIETTEAVSGDKPPILEETVGYIATPGDTVPVTLGKRKSEVTSGDVAGSSRRQKIVARKPPLGGPGLKPKTSGTPPQAAVGRVFTSTDSDSSSSDSSDSSFSPDQTEGGSGAGCGVSKVPSRGSSPEASRDVEVNASDPFVPDWKLTNGTFLDTPSLCKEFMMSVRPPAEESRDMSLSHRRLSNEGCSAAINAFFSFIEIHQRYTEGVLENRDMKKRLAELQEKCTTLESNVATLQSDKEQSANLIKDMEIKNLQTHTVMKDDLDKKARIIESMTRDRINSLADAVGFNAGLKEGVRLGKIGKGPGDDPKYDPSALSKLKELSDEFDDATFPVIATMSSMHGATLSEIQDFLKDPTRSDP